MRREILQLIFVLGIFGGSGRTTRYAATQLNVALSAGHIDVTKFLPWSPIAVENHLDRAELKKFHKLLRKHFSSVFRHFEPISRRGFAHPNHHE